MEVVIVIKNLTKNKKPDEMIVWLFYERIPQSSTVAHVLRTDYIFFTTGIMPICFIFWIFV